MIRLPIPLGRVMTLSSVSVSEAESCPVWREFTSEESTSLYKTRKEKVTCENGTFTNTYTFAGGIRINGEGECESPSIETDAEEGKDYGDIESVENTFEDPIDESTIMTAAESHPQWTDYEGSGAFGYRTKETVFTSLAEINMPIGLAIKTGPTLVDVGGSLGKFMASVQKTRVKFVLRPGLSCKVEIDREYVNTEGDVSYTGGTSFLLTPSSPEHIVDIEPAAENVSVRLRVRRVLPLPVTA